MKVLIMGLGLHGGGVSSAKFFCRQGADVLVTDLKTKENLQKSIDKLKKFKIRYTLGKHEEKDFLWADLIIKNPDVPNSSPYLEIARKNNIPIETDINLFLKLSGAYVIGVTGTKGKSTTASLIYHLLKSKYKKVLLAGNIGFSPLEIMSKVSKNTPVVLELSSFELEGLTKSPNIAVITNIMPDHLNRYASMAEYVESKKNIFKYQSENDVLVLNGDDFIVRQFATEAKSKVVFFSKNIKPKGFKLFGSHNLSNLSAAIEVAKIMKVTQKEIDSKLKTFKGVQSRQEFVKEVNGVKYFNDTTSTMPDATITAINSFSEKFKDSNLIFICGGQNKKLEYAGLAEEIKNNVDKLIMLPGTASDRIKQHLKDYKELYEVFSMQEAVKKAKDLAKKGDVVVLSPAAASFNLFDNEFDRGSQFVNAVKKISKK